MRAALEEIDNLIGMIECTDKHNLALLPLFLAEQKRALAALPLIRAAALEEAAQVAEESRYFGLVKAKVLTGAEIAAKLRALKEQP